MPSSTVTPDFEVSVPQSQVPIRQGEEKSAGLLELDNQLRREAAGLQKRPVGGKSSRELQRILGAKVKELKAATMRQGDRWVGPCVPATVINLNPIPLTLSGELQRWSMPAAGQGKTVKLTYKGRVFVGSYMTFTEPHVWPRPTGVTSDNAASMAMPTIEARYIPPIGLAHQFFSHYVEGAQDSQQMGGILSFEGDIHTLEKLDKTDGLLWVPQETFLPESQGFVYTLMEVVFVDYLARALTMQRNYGDRVVSEGHSFATSSADAIKNQLTGYHRLWHNWALERGYKKEAEAWASERLEDSPNIEAVFCPDCSQRRANPTQYFCQNCNAPFDACKAFLDGKMVSEDRLAAYPSDGEEFALIQKELKRRRANIALLADKTKKPKEDKD